MPIDHHRARIHALQRRLDGHWHELLRVQIAAYVLVAFFWALPVPNPIKVVAVTFHEISHGIAALLTGGSVFGYAISPGGGGVTFGVGGNYLIILLAGYTGSCFAGTLLYVATVRWKPASAIIAIEIFILATAYLGWLTNATVLYGLLSMALMTAILWTPEWTQLLYIRVLGSACCLYAPLEVVAGIMATGSPPSVLGYATESDLTQIAQYLQAPAPLVGLVLLLLQVALVVALVRWTCEEGARARLRQELAPKIAHRQRVAELRAFSHISHYKGRRP